MSESSVRDNPPPPSSAGTASSRKPCSRSFAILAATYLPVVSLRLSSWASCGPISAKAKRQGDKDVSTFRKGRVIGCSQRQSTLYWAARGSGRDGDELLRTRAGDN